MKSRRLPLPFTNILMAASEPYFSKKATKTRKPALRKPPSKLAQIVASNLELRKHHADGEEKWERTNNRAFLQLVSTLKPEDFS